MTEIAGLIIGGVALSGVFETCLENFARIQLGRHFGTDFERCLVRLDVERLKLSRWGESIRMVHGATSQATSYSIPVASQNEGEKIEGILGSILSALLEAEETSRQYQTGDAPSQQQSAHDARLDANLAPSLTSIHQKWVKSVINRQKSTSMAKITSWVLHKRNVFNDLIGHIRNLVDGLYVLYPPPKALQMELCQHEIAKLTQPELQLLENSTIVDADEALQSTVRQTAQRQRHNFEHISIQGDGMGRMGDELAGGARQSGQGSTYRDIQVSGRGVAHLGDSFGGESIFRVAGRR